MRLLERGRSGQFHLLLAGDGPLRAGLERLCERDLPGAVGFIGYIRNRETLADIYANCDALLHPNPREPFGIAPLEAMASGLPLIGPNSGGLICYAHSGNAWLLNPDPESFANAAVALRHEPGRAEVLRQAGRATAERFDWPTVASSFFALYEELCAVAHGARPEPAMAPGVLFQLSWHKEAFRMGSVDQPFRVLSRRAFARTLAGAALARACATAE